MYYSEAISFPPLFTLLVFVLYAIIALAPAYGVFRQKDYVTALICAVCGLFGVFVLPYLAAVVIALKKLPRDQEPVIDPKIRTALFGGTLAAVHDCSIYQFLWRQHQRLYVLL